jgi:hypothetical protein
VLPARQGKKVVTTLLRRSGRGEDVLRADQPITRGRWTRAGTDGIHGDQGDPEGPSGETGLAPPAMKPPLPEVRPTCACPPPALLGCSRHAAPPGLVCQRDGKQRTNFERWQPLGQDAGRSMLRLYPNPQLDDDLTVRPLPPFPRPKSCRFNDRLAKAHRNPGPPSRGNPHAETGDHPWRMPPVPNSLTKCKHPPTKPPEGANGSGIVRELARRQLQSIALKISPASG